MASSCLFVWLGSGCHLNLVSFDWTHPKPDTNLTSSVDIGVGFAAVGLLSMRGILGYEGRDSRYT